MSLFYLQWHITDQCNNRCTHCYQNQYNSDNDVNVEDAKEIVADFTATCLELNAQSIISITGGDPLLNKNFFKIATLASDQCDQVYVMGNPEFLIINNGLDISAISRTGIKGWRLSLDGLRNTHDKIRYKGSFDCTLQAIEKLNQIGIEVSIMSTVNRDNLNEMSSLMELLYNRGVYSWDFCRYIPPTGHCCIEPDDYKRFLMDIIT